MSTAIARNFQIGIDPTPTNNFTLYQPATPDGTLRLGNGNTGITSSLLTLTSAGSLNFGGTAVRITGDFSNATLANRVYFQNSTSAQTALGVLPGSGFAIAAANIFSQSDPANSALLQMRIENTVDARISSGVTGTGSFVPMTFYTGGSERMRLDTSGNLGVGTSSPATRLDVNGTATTTALTVNGNNISAVNSLGFRNRIINGDMRIDQRNAGASVTSGYPVDRWRPDTTAQSSFSYQQNAGSVTPPTGFVNYLGCTSTAAYSPGSNTTVRIAQTVEGFNVADLAWGTANAQTVTLSFWVRSSLTGTHSGSAVNSSGTRSYVYSFTISSANTWEYKTIVIPGDTTGTWLTNNGIGLIIGFNLGTGTGTYGTTTAGTWQSGNLVGLTNAVQVSATNGATFYITGVQLEAGSVATPFERRDYGRELIMCQRYFYIFGAFNFGTNAFYNGYYGGSTAVLNVRYPVQMRATPTATVSQPTQVQYYSQGNVWTNTTITIQAYNSSSPNYNAGTTDITIGCASDSVGGGKLLYLVGGASTTLPTVSVSAEL